MNPDEIPPDAFDELVRNALDQLPDEAAALVAHIAVVVREQPEPAGVTPGQLLLGTFRGIAHTRVGGRVPGSLPDVITLYRLPILHGLPQRGRGGPAGAQGARPRGRARPGAERGAAARLRLVLSSHSGGRLSTVDAAN